MPSYHHRGRDSKVRKCLNEPLLQNPCANRVTQTEKASDNDNCVVLGLIYFPLPRVQFSNLQSLIPLLLHKLYGLNEQIKRNRESYALLAEEPRVLPTPPPGGLQMVLL